MINTDEKKLATILGFPNETLVLQNDHERRAARVITDSAACQSGKEALFNAASWTADAYREGFEAGKLAERGEWKARIARVFGL
jgi:hypothetical protein